MLCASYLFFVAAASRRVTLVASKPCNHHVSRTAFSAGKPAGSTTFTRVSPKDAACKMVTFPTIKVHLHLRSTSKLSRTDTMPRGQGWAWRPASIALITWDTRMFRLWVPKMEYRGSFFMQLREVCISARLCTVHRGERRADIVWTHSYAAKLVATWPKPGCWA